VSVFVVHASVVIKWFVPEIHSDAARRLLDATGHYVAPDLLFPELGNTTWKKVRREGLSARQGRELVADLATVAVETVPERSLFEDAYGVAIATGLTVYDATYVALAARLETNVIMADARLVRTAASTPMIAGYVRAVQEAPRVPVAPKWLPKSRRSSPDPTCVLPRR
jgi:predicted nucleic acid-binding protein